MRHGAIAGAVCALLLAAAASLPGAERIRIAVLPPTGESKKLGEVHTGEFVHETMVEGMAKVERFDQMSVGDVTRLLEEGAIPAEDLKVEKASEIAKRLKVRLLLFVSIDKVGLEVETEDKVIIQTKVAVATATLSATLFDAATARTTAMGPYAEEERSAGAAGGTGRFALTARQEKELVEKALENGAKKIRARIYKLYPLAGAITAAGEGKITLDIGKSMGVAAGQRYVVYGMVEKENSVTGLKEKVRDEVSLLEVSEVTDDAATCKVVKGEPSPPIGSAVERDLRE